MRTSIAVIVALVSSVAIADFCDYVDPFVGTAGTGHTFPGACVPFGMIQAGPGEQNKTADRVREVFDRFYLPKPEGLCGNDDCGQMSAWYLFSAMGFYPFNPCGGDYVVGAPQVPRVVIKLENQVGVGERIGADHSPTRTSSSNSFTITAKGLSKDCKHVKSMMLNGKPFKGPILKHSEIMAGGELVFEMCE